MIFFQGFLKAISNSFKGFSLVFEKGLWPYLFYPLILWFLMWAGSIWLFAGLANSFAEYFNQKLNLNDIPDSGNWLSFAKPFLTGYFSFILAWIFKIAFWFVSNTFSKYLVLIFFSPLFALLSESTEEKLNGNNFPFNFLQLIKDVFRGVLMSLRNMLLEYFFIALCFVITLFFPPLIFLSAPFLLVVSWYFLGFTMMDYNFERHKMSVSQSVKFTRKNMGTACGIGAIYSFLMLLPWFVGLMFGPVLAVVGATICFLEIKKQNTLTSV
jgi:CysZ protein